MNLIFITILFLFLIKLYYICDMKHKEKKDWIDKKTTIQIGIENSVLKEFADANAINVLQSGIKNWKRVAKKIIFKPI